MERLKALYLGLPTGLRAALPGRLEVWLRDRVLPAWEGRTRARRLEVLLWGGFSRAALAELSPLAADPAAPGREAAAAALALARWHGAAGDFAAALGAVEVARARAPRLGRDRRHYLLEAMFLLRLGRAAEARALLEARAGRRFDPSAELLRATAWNPAVDAAGDAGRALGHLNGILARAGLSPLARRDPAAPLGFDALAGTAAPGSRRGPLVSVIVPLHNGARTIGTALAGLCAQTWGDLEILVVDDASTDDGPARVTAAAARDPRIRLIRRQANGGAYAARNRGLAEARGAFVTTHDSDDWSHPEKIARLVDALDGGRTPFAISAWARADDRLAFWGPWQPSPNMVGPDFSSVLFSRDVLDVVGRWDTARTGADREFVARIERIFGAKPLPVLPAAPLAFGRLGPASLTRAEATHAATALHGVRREYREAAAFWHAGLDAAAIRRSGLAAEPPLFPAPAPLRPERTAPDPDLLVIGDFNLLGGTQHSAMHLVRAARSAGLAVAILHHRRPDLDPTRPLRAEMRRAALDLDLRIVAPGEALAAETVILTYPPLLDQAMDRFPRISHDRLGVLVNQMAERDRAGTSVAYDPARVRAHLADAFGWEGEWLPISARVRALMAADPRYPAPGAGTWTPLVDTETWCARPIRWRGGERRRPVLGRHGRDHPLKWPAARTALRHAYCAGRPCETRFLGGARYARPGLWPRNWRVEPFGARDVRDFLAELDVFLHYPHPEYVEEFGRAPMEAMATGIPVVLPPEFEPTFGPAALYAAPDEVWDRVDALWRDEAAWTAQAERGRAFVRTHCAYAVLPDRLARLSGRPRASSAPAGAVHEAVREATPSCRDTHAAARAATTSA
jgi:hypothetical protein